MTPSTNHNNRTRNATVNKKKKSHAAKPDHVVMKQRREAIETRISKMQAKIEKDRALLLKYSDTAVSTSSSLTVPIDDDDEDELAQPTTTTEQEFLITEPVGAGDA